MAWISGQEIGALCGKKERFWSIVCQSIFCRELKEMINSAKFCVIVVLLGLRELPAVAEEDYEEGYCAPYNGKVCKSFIGSRQVWYSREDPTGGWENEKITTGLWEEMISELPTTCRTAAEVIPIELT